MTGGQATRPTDAARETGCVEDEARWTERLKTVAKAAADGEPVAKRRRQFSTQSGHWEDRCYKALQKGSQWRLASVFLSYDREDIARARAMAAALEKAGHIVWWDRHIKGGAQYGKEIERALKRADAVVVLWSKQSVESAWVRDEAAAGRDSGRLVPAIIEPVEPPMGFRQYQTIDLSRWKGRVNSAHLKNVVEAVEALAESAGTKAGGAPLTTLPQLRRWNSQVSIAALIALAAVIGAALFVWSPWAPEGVTLVVVSPADGERASRELARNLTVKLGSLPSAHSSSMRLIAGDDRSAQKAGLILQAAVTASSGATRASLMLKGRTDGAILWSKDFEQPSSNRADLNQQMALTSARVLGCAMDGLQAGERLSPETLKIYLNACAQLADIGGTDPRPVIPMLLTVIGEAQRFKPAWRNLLLAEATTVTGKLNRGEPPHPRAVSALREHIRRSRQIEPNMAEAYLAEFELMPPREISRGMALVEHAAQQSPDDPVVLRYRSGALARVGRSRDAVELAKRSAELDPLSPDTLQNYISALAYAGRFEAAERELRRAERLWAGTAALRDAQFRYHFRHGDPRKALAMEESDSAGGAPRLYLKTRIEPTKENVRRLFQHIRGALATPRNPAARIGFAALAYGEFGGNEELFKLLLNWQRPDDLGAIAESFFRPQLRQFRRDPRFMQVAKRAGLLDYWRTSGQWPDFCFDPDQPYDCKAEAEAKIPQ